MDTQNDGLEKMDSFKIWPLLASMLDFWGVTWWVRKKTLLHLPKLRSWWHLETGTKAMCWVPLRDFMWNVNALVRILDFRGQWILSIFVLWSLNDVFWIHILSPLVWWECCNCCDHSNLLKMFLSGMNAPNSLSTRNTDVNLNFTHNNNNNNSTCRLKATQKRRRVQFFAASGDGVW